MNLRKSLTAVAAATLLATGLGTGAAHAQTPRAPTSRPDAAARLAKRCERAPEALVRMREHVQKVDERIVKLTRAKAAAVAAGNTERAAKVQARIDRLTQHKARAEAHMAKVRTACRLSS